MSSDWRTAPLGEIAANVSKPFNFKDRDSVIFINTGDILKGDFLHRTATSPKGLPGQAKKAIANGDILYSEIRPGNKRYLLVHEDNVDDFVVSTKFMVIRPKEVVCPEFLYLVLTSNDCEAEFKVIADSRSGTFPQITFDSISHYPIKYPSSNLQNRIVDFDSAFTKKIKLNRKINQTLEQIAQAIFKSWFVDFEPVKAKINALEAGGSDEDALLAAMQAISGKDKAQLTQLKTENPEHYKQLRTTAELFPSAMQESELGDIPEGWQVKQLSELVTLLGGGTPKKSEPSYWDGHICWFSVKDIPQPGNVFVVDTMEKITDEGLNKSSAKLLPVGTTIISARGTVGKLALTGIPTAMNQSCYGVISNDNSGPYFNYLRLHRAVEILKRNTHGAVFDTITRNTFETVVQIAPSINLRQQFEAVVRPMFETIKSNVTEISTLTRLRESLLPKLLSGELDLKFVPDNDTKLSQNSIIKS